MLNCYEIISRKQWVKKIMVDMGEERGWSWDGKVNNKQGFSSVEKAVNLYCGLFCKLKLATSWG